MKFCEIVLHNTRHLLIGRNDSGQSYVRVDILKRRESSEVGGQQFDNYVTLKGDSLSSMKRIALERNGASDVASQFVAAALRYNPNNSMHLIAARPATGDFDR